MFDSSHGHGLVPVVDMVNDAICADPDSVETVLTLQDLASVWTRFLGERGDRWADSLPDGAGQGECLLAGGSGYDEAVGRGGHGS